MFKRLGVFGLMLVAGTAAMVQPAAAFGYERGQGYVHYDRDDHRRYDRDFRRDYEWRERESREHAWREREWRERERWQNRGYNSNYAPGYYNNPAYSRPY